MNSSTTVCIPQTSDSTICVGASLFCDDVWDLSPVITQKSLSPSRKKVNFTSIHSPQLKHTVKQYIFYKLGQVKPQSAVGTMHSLSYFMRYCKREGICALDKLTAKTLISFALWMRRECGISQRTGYKASYAVEEMLRIGQIKGWLVPKEDVLLGATAAIIWGSGGDKDACRKIAPIPDEIFDKIISCAMDYKAYHTGDVLTKCGIIIQSQTGLRINEVLSMKSGCLHQLENGPAYFEVSISKTAKGDPIVHQVFANELVIHAIQELERGTAELRKESGLPDLFLMKNNGICVPKVSNWSKNRLRTFIRRCNICDANGKLYHLTSHQFRSTFVKQMVIRNIPISYVMKQFAHVSIEMTCHYLTLREEEVKRIYSRLVLSPKSKIAGLGAEKIQSATSALFRGKTEQDIDDIIDRLSASMSFNPLPGGVCLYDYRRGNCANGDGCFFYNCPNFVTEVSFLPVLQKELQLMETEMRRTKQLGYERQWQIQNSKYQCLQPLVTELEEKLHASEDEAKCERSASVYCKSEG